MSQIVGGDNIKPTPFANFTGMTHALQINSFVLQRHIYKNAFKKLLKGILDQ